MDQKYDCILRSVFSVLKSDLSVIKSWSSSFFWTQDRSHWLEVRLYKSVLPLTGIKDWEIFPSQFGLSEISVYNLVFPWFISTTVKVTTMFGKSKRFFKSSIDELVLEDQLYEGYHCFSVLVLFLLSSDGKSEEKDHCRQSAGLPERWTIRLEKNVDLEAHLCSWSWTYGAWINTV